MDDHLCPSNQWSREDGQCIDNRLLSQRVSVDTTCHSRCEQYFMCETHPSTLQWTMENGRCFRGDDRYRSLNVTSRNNEEQCGYLLGCALSLGAHKNCAFNKDFRCVEELSRQCRLSVIRYPREAVMTPFTFLLFNRQRRLTNNRPDLLDLNGTVWCRHALVTVRGTRIPFDTNSDPRRMNDEHFCAPFASNISSSSILSTRHSYHHESESSDLCQEWNPCLSNTRIRDGSKNCLDESDELEESEIEMQKHCARVRRHRCRCSNFEWRSVVSLSDHIGRSTIRVSKWMWWIVVRSGPNDFFYRMQQWKTRSVFSSSSIDRRWRMGWCRCSGWTLLVEFDHWMDTSTSIFVWFHGSIFLHSFFLPTSWSISLSLFSRNSTRIVVFHSESTGWWKHRLCGRNGWITNETLSKMFSIVVVDPRIEFPLSIDEHLYSLLFSLLERWLSMPEEIRSWILVFPSTATLRLFPSEWFRLFRWSMLQRFRVFLILWGWIHVWLSKFIESISCSLSWRETILSRKKIVGYWFAWISTGCEDLQPSASL